MSPLESSSPMSINAPKIYQAISAIMGEIGVVGKTTRAQGLPYSFRSADDIINVISPLLVKYKVCIFPREVESISEMFHNSAGKQITRVSKKMEYKFVSTEDGSSETVCMGGEGLDFSDKASSKAQTMAFKYMFAETFAIATEDPDPDSERPEVGEINPGEHIINFGKSLKNKKIKDVPIQDLDSYADWLESSANKKGEKVSGDAKTFIDMVALFKKEKA